MPNYRVSEVAELLGISPDTVRRWADEGQLPTKRTKGGHRVVDGKILAAFVADHREDEEAAIATSARNQFGGIVIAVIRDKVAASVEIQAGPHRIVSLMTREGADALALEPGMRATATVKATNVSVELP